MNDITVNEAQELFVIPAGDGLSCLGFENCFQQARQLMARLGQAAAHLGAVREQEKGKLVQYVQYRELLRIARKQGGFEETWFSPGTPAPVREILERYRKSGQRIRLYYGDPETGRDWLEEYDTIGQVGRSTGITKVPLLLTRRNASGGGAILDDCIVKLQDVETKRVLWQHPGYSQPELKVEGGKVTCGGKPRVYMAPKDAQAYVQFLQGTRMRKY